jgi:hypothetical protein
MVSMSHFVEILTTPLVYFIVWMHNLCSVVLGLSLRDTVLHPVIGERGWSNIVATPVATKIEPEKRGREVGAPFPLYSPSPLSLVREPQAPIYSKRGREVGAPFPLYSPSPLPLVREPQEPIHSHARGASTWFSPLTMLHKAAIGPCRSRS